MTTRTLISAVLIVAGSILMLGVAAPLLTQDDSTAVAAGTHGSRLAAAATVADTITYQGRLTTPDGTPLNGDHTMQFQLYDTATGGTALWDSGNTTVNVQDGLFRVNLNVDHADFDGGALWLRIRVGGEWLSPRQEILPAPYALSLKPGADVSGEPLASSDAVLGVTLEGTWPAGKAVHGYAPATGTAVYAQAGGGQGIFASSDDNYGVWGESTNSWGGYFASDNGYGIRVSTDGTDHWDHGAYVQSSGGYGVYATSSGNMAVRGEAGDTSGLWQPVGSVGVVGIGASRGLYGSGGSSYGIYGTSLNWYGIYGRTSRSDDNYGLYTPDNLFSKNINMTGATMQVAQNNGSETIEPGDVVVFNGIDSSSLEDVPMIQVAKATSANSTAVAGVAHSGFNMKVAQAIAESPNATVPPDTDMTPTGPVQPAEYLLVIVQGPAQVKADALSTEIQPGDLLTTSDSAGYATKAAEIDMNGVTVTAPGTTFGKALESPESGRDTIYVYVTLQ